jgi:hypothetical protein
LIFISLILCFPHRLVKSFFSQGGGKRQNPNRGARRGRGRRVPVHPRALVMEGHDQPLLETVAISPSRTLGPRSARRGRGGRSRRLAVVVGTSFRESPRADPRGRYYRARLLGWIMTPKTYLLIPVWPPGPSGNQATRRLRVRGVSSRSSFSSRGLLPSIASARRESVCSAISPVLWAHPTSPVLTCEHYSFGFPRRPPGIKPPGRTGDLAASVYGVSNMPGSQTPRGPGVARVTPSRCRLPLNSRASAS